MLKRSSNSFALAWLALLGLMAAAPIAQANGGKQTDKIVLGRLGQTIRQVGIHTETSISSSVYYQATSFQYIVLRPCRNPEWVGVLMSNGVTGFIPKDSSVELPYQVTENNPRSVPGYGNAGSARGAEAAALATNYIGVPYVWGGTNLQKGVDCSGFVKDMFGAIGIDLPRTAAEQALVGTPVTRLEDLKPGDRLYFWEDKRHEIGHTGIYMGNGVFIHSSVGHHGVAVSSLTKSWQKILVAARRGA